MVVLQELSFLSLLLLLILQMIWSYRRVIGNNPLIHFFLQAYSGKLIRPPLTVEKWLIHLIGVGAIMAQNMWEKRRTRNNSGEVIQVGLKDTTDGIRTNVFGCAMEHSIQNVFSLPHPSHGTIQ